LADADEINEGGGKLDIELWDYKFRNHCLVSTALCHCHLCKESCAWDFWVVEMSPGLHCTGVNTAL